MHKATFTHFSFHIFMFYSLVRQDTVYEKISDDNGYMIPQPLVKHEYTNLNHGKFLIVYRGGGAYSLNLLCFKVPL